LLCDLRTVVVDRFPNGGLTFGDNMPEQALEGLNNNNTSGVTDSSP